MAYGNYDCDEDDVDEYEGASDYDEGAEEEVAGDDSGKPGPEDQAQLEAGTAEVVHALADEAAKVTTQQIQDSLWYYYYDIDKTIAYLLRTYIAPEPKPESKRAKKAAAKNNGQDLADLLPARHVSFAHFFRDMPWLNIPKDKETTFIAPICPRGGLLGGSGKMSKLQQLAAARKKKAEEQKAEDTGKGNDDATSETVAAADVRIESQGHTVPQVAQPETSAPAGSQKRKNSEIAQVDGPPFKSPKGSPVPDAESEQDTTPEEAGPAAPSSLAQALLGSAPTPAASRAYALPYMAFMPTVTDAFAEPSPDDVVQNAQAKASNKKLASAAKKKEGSNDKVDQAADGIKALKVDDTPLPKSKNLDVVGEYKKSKSKRNVSFVVVGHVDAGKSTLMGRLLLDLKVVDQRTINKYRKEAELMGKSSFALAWVLDQGTTERSRGVTIDIATIGFETEKTAFTILDAPGHRDFVPNMIAGASQADFAILVVDASTGAFEAGLKGQTREHALLLRSMGVSRIIVAVNKLDTVGWPQERFDEISNQVTGFLSAANFQLKKVTFVPVSGLHGHNMVKGITDPAASWYKGGTLLQELEKSEPLERALDKPLRLPIAEVYKTIASPLAISGRIEAGTLQVGDGLLLQPSGEKGYVNTLEVNSAPADWAVAGQNVVISLSHIDPTHVRIGDIACNVKSPAPCLDTLTLKVLAFDMLIPGVVDVHRGRLHTAGRIMEIPALLHKHKGHEIKKKPAIVKPGSVARVVIKLDKQVPLEPGQRVVLRSAGDTIAAGMLE